MWIAPRNTPSKLRLSYAISLSSSLKLVVRPGDLKRALIVCYGGRINLQTIIQVICSQGGSVRESIVSDRKLADYSLVVSKQRAVGRNPGWAKIYSTENGVPGVLNVVWHKESLILVGRVVTKGSSKPDDLLGYFVTYLLARHLRRIKMISILPG